MLSFNVAFNPSGNMVAPIVVSVGPWGGGVGW